MNVENLQECVKVMINGDTRVFCVECNSWHYVAVITPSIVTFHLSGARRIEPDFSQAIYACQLCNADVGYLLNAEQRQAVIKKVVPE